MFHNLIDRLMECQHCETYFNFRTVCSWCVTSIFPLFLFCFSIRLSTSAWFRISCSLMIVCSIVIHITLCNDYTYLHILHIHLNTSSNRMGTYGKLSPHRTCLICIRFSQLQSFCDERTKIWKVELDFHTFMFSQKSYESDATTARGKLKSWNLHQQDFGKWKTRLKPEFNEEFYLLNDFGDWYQLTASAETN